MTQPPPVSVCYRHPDRETLIGCQRCRRPICPECMTTAPVGVQCPECVREGMRATRSGVGPLGGRPSADPRRTSLILIGLNLAVFVVILASGGWDSVWVNRLGISPQGMCLLTDGSGNYYPGVTPAQCATLLDAGWVDGVATGAWWQVLTSAFTHAEILHLGSNLLALWFLGPPLEQVLGRVRFLAVYGISALTASAAVMWLSAPDSVAVGASGAIFGMLGALLLLAKRFGGNYQMIAGFLVLNIVITVMGGGYISWQAHLGGLIGGLASAAALTLPPRERRPAGQLIGLLALTVVTLAAIGWRAIMLA